MKEQTKRIVFICCAVGLAVCVIIMGIIALIKIKDEKLQQSLLDTMNERDVENDEEAEESQEDVILSKFTQLYKENSDLAGWISIADTEINYPVMHTPEDAEYYLHKDFNGDYSIGGTIFASWDSTFTPRSDNIILYGHNMGNGSMFADLLKYSSETYWEEHKTIQFDTLTKEQTYEIVYAFVVDVGVNNPHFEFYNYINASNEEEFDEFIENCKTYSYYDTENDPEYGDSLLTLVTCKGYDTTERMVVVAKSICG
ncbi:MAG: class B sortase [Eubacteriales bacterium]